MLKSMLNQSSAENYLGNLFTKTKKKSQMLKVDIMLKAEDSHR